MKALVQETHLVPPPPELIVVLALVLEVLQAVLVLGPGHIHKFVISGLEAGGEFSNTAWPHSLSTVPTRLMLAKI